MAQLLTLSRLQLETLWARAAQLIASLRGPEDDTQQWEYRFTPIAPLTTARQVVKADANRRFLSFQGGSANLACVWFGDGSTPACPYSLYQTQTPLIFVQRVHGPLTTLQWYGIDGSGLGSALTVVEGIYKRVVRS